MYIGILQYFFFFLNTLFRVVKLLQTFRTILPIIGNCTEMVLYLTLLELKFIFSVMIQKQKVRLFSTRFESLDIFAHHQQRVKGFKIFRKSVLKILVYRRYYIAII